MNAFTLTLDMEEATAETTEEAVRTLATILSRSPMPSVIASDKDSSIISAQKHLNEMGFSDLTITPAKAPAHPEVIAPLERSHTEFDRFRRSHPEWYEQRLLPKFIRQFNDSNFPGHEFSRNEVLYGLTVENSKTLAKKIVEADHRKKQSMPVLPESKKLKVGNRVVVLSKAKHKGEPNALPATVVSVSESGANVEVVDHASGRRSHQSSRNTQRIGDIPLELTNTGEEPLQPGSHALYRYSKRTFVAKITQIDNSGIHVLSCIATPDTHKKRPEHRVYIQDGLECIIRREDIFATGKLTPQGKLSPHLARSWTAEAVRRKKK